jgi:hypothetical protein
VHPLSATQVNTSGIRYPFSTATTALATRPPPPAPPPPPRAPGARWLEEKRVRNRRLKEELGLALEFPSFREGLAAIAAGDARPFLDLDDARLALGG